MEKLALAMLLIEKNMIMDITDFRVTEKFVSEKDGFYLQIT